MDENKNKASAMVATVVFHFAIIAILLWVTLSFTGVPKKVWPPEDTSEILLEDEYVEILTPKPRLKTVKDPAKSEESQPDPIPDAQDRVDAGEPAPEVPVVQTTPRESPVKVKQQPVPEKSGPTQAEIEAEAKAKREAEAQERIQNRVSFNKKSGEGSNDGKGKGNDAATSHGSKPGFNLRGRSIEKWDSPRATLTGTIVIEVRVDREGKVIKASYQSGNGAVAADESARRSCIAAAMASRFSVDLNARAEQTGTISYRFE